jgi:2-dehydro-3-deoxyphosphogluconate aldolase/(4S)-4-hydroxy-2-oxoglutarate aldolase
MDAQTGFDYVERCGLMAGMRGKFPPETALRICEALVEEGINVFEFTLNSSQAIEGMQLTKRELGSSVCAGMGTVLDVDAARRVLDAEPDFIVAPAFNPEVVKTVQAANVFIAPGVITPTECVDAWAMGVKLLKIFPIGPLGLDYFKAVRAPLDHMKFLCSGGMNTETVALYLKAGATACNTATWLTGDGSLPLETVRERGRTMRGIVDEARTGVKRGVTI